MSAQASVIRAGAQASDTAAALPHARTGAEAGASVGARAGAAGICTVLLRPLASVLALLPASAQTAARVNGVVTLCNLHMRGKQRQLLPQGLSQKPTMACCQALMCSTRKGEQHAHEQLDMPADYVRRQCTSANPEQKGQVS